MKDAPGRLAANVAAGLALLALAGAVPARADFGPIELRSSDALEQAEAAGETAISADGKYLAFEGALAGKRGVFRKDLRDGTVALVAGGSAYTPEAGVPTDASAPSIGADGRYVSFTSEAALVGTAHAGSNVYVRDMSLPAPAGGGACSASEESQRRCAYELASARNGGEEGLSYGGKEGAIASARVALSASGRELAFVVRGVSDLTAANPGELATPPLQVAVRDLDTRQTVLVSAEREASTGQMTERPVAGGAVTPSLQAGTLAATVLPGAALSGDGTTVAWLGARIPAQAPTLQGERQQIEADDEKPAADDEAYDEPLWRRIADGVGARTRRMTGGGDPLAPGCPPEGTSANPDCRGPYQGLTSEHWASAQSHYGWLGLTSVCDGTPQLSYDGWSAATIGDPDGSANVFAIDMSEGLDRDQAVRQLTREVPVAGLEVPGLFSRYVSGAGEVHELAISPDATRIAFTTQRQQFPLAPPNYTETPPVQLGVGELYEIDLTDESLVRVTRGPDGAASLQPGFSGSVTSQGAAAPSYSADDRTLAFADTASNLVFGDANDASDAFTIFDEPATATAGPVTIGPSPPGLEPVRPQRRLSVVALTRSDGSVTLEATVPEAGELTATATSTVPVAVRPRSSKASRAPSRPARRTVLALRTVGAARERSATSGVRRLTLRVSPRYARLLNTRAGVYALIRVAFRSTGGPTLTQTLHLSLRRVVKRFAARSRRRASAANDQRGRRASGRVGGRG